MVLNFSRFSQVAGLVAVGLCGGLSAEPQTSISRVGPELASVVGDAEHGDTDAQRTLGFLYLDGQGVPQDFENAAYWFRQAANSGDAVAQNNLGVMYLNGQGVPPDSRVAIQWFRRAANQEDPRAQFNLALSYETGRGVDQNYNAAAEW